MVETLEVVETVEAEKDIIKDYKVMIGFYGDERSYYSDYRELLIFCNCGFTTSTRIRQGRDCTQTCPTCGTLNVKRVNRPKTGSKGIKTVVDGVIETIEKDEKSFWIKKTEVTAHVKVLEDDGYEVEFIKGKEFELTYSLRTKTIKVFKDDNEIANNDDNVDIFFRGQMSSSDILDAISCESNREMFRLAIINFGKERYERIEKIGRALRRLFNYPGIEILNSCGFKDLRYLYNNLHYARSNETKPHEIMGLSKMSFNMIRDIESIGWYTHQNLQNLEKRIDGNTIREVLQIMKEESKIDNFISNADLVIALRENYGYKDLKRLMLYACREVKLQQGIDNPNNALTILRDYARMCTDMNIDFDKYPKSLKKDHDISQMNYRVQKDKIKAEKFLNVVESEEYSNLAYTPKKEKDKEKDPYVIVAPKESTDLIQEGDSLSHCVASYVDDVIKGTCKVVFMRLAENPEKSFITIEVRDGNIRQARGQSNRSLTAEEMLFVSKWAENKKLRVAMH